MKRLYFCRHGLSELNKAGIWSGSLDTPLAPEGRQQAEAAAVIASILRIDYIYSSSLSRAYDTAVIIAEAIGYPVDKIEQSDLAIERHFGVIEGTPWGTDVVMDSVPDAESSRGVIARAQSVYQHLQTIDANNILIVSHGTFGRALRHVIHPDIPFDDSGKFTNAEIVQLL
ncbi:MAG TPA: histidine phosphatase family protein [Candidatus Saccharimonadales bacterium]|jgi:broad specificity phosphatase PhoE